MDKLLNLQQDQEWIHTMKKRYVEKNKIKIRIPGEVQDQEFIRQLDDYEVYYNDLLEDNQELINKVISMQRTQAQMATQLANSSGNKVPGQLPANIQKMQKNYQDQIEELRSKLRQMENNLDSRDESMQELKKRNTELEIEHAKMEERMKTVDEDQSNQYEKFEELNKYINDLLQEKKKLKRSVQLKTK